METVWVFALNLCGVFEEHNPFFSLNTNTRDINVRPTVLYPKSDVNRAAIGL